MKRRQKLSWFLSGMLMTALLVSLASPAFAALTGKSIYVYTGISVMKDGVAFQPKDANGNPVELFAYNGTTYVPARAFSEAMGVPINYDGNTQTVYIGEVPGQKQYLLDVCPPYQSNNYNTPELITMAGHKYANGFTLGGDWLYDNGWALYNLNGQYQTLEFDVGHIDGRNMSGAPLNIYLDGKLQFSADLTGEMLPTHYSVPLYGALQMKIETTGGYGYCYGLVNVTIK